MKTLIIGSLLLGGAFLVYNSTQKPNPAKVQSLVNQANSSGEGKYSYMFAKMSKDEIDLFYDAQILKKYGSIYPDSIKLKIANILLRFGFTPT
jgi:hypothetical protein